MSIAKDLVLDILPSSQDATLTVREIATITGLDENAAGKACRTLQKFKLAACHWKYVVREYKMQAANIWWKVV